MIGIQYYIANSEYQRIFVWLCQVFIGSISILITILVFVWGLYFACRIREFSKKVYYLKKQTDERCKEELANAKVELKKSIFLTVICLTEVLDFVSVMISLIFHDQTPNQKGDCPGNNLVKAIQLDWFIRYSIAITVSCIIIYTSLVHTLTSYMANAYAEKRVVKLSRREKLLLLLMFTQVAIVLLSVFEWRAFAVIVLLAAITVFPMHILFFYKFSRKLYTALKRRTLDAWFEDIQQHKRLKGMCHEYKWGTIMYGVTIVMIGLTISLMPVGSLGRMLFKESCWLNQLFGINKDFHWLNDVYKRNNQTLDIFGDIATISYNLLAVISVLSLLSLNVSILCNAVYRLIKRRIAYNNYTGTRLTELYRPLIGNK